jgi:LAGLIDADG endonuclease
MDHIKTLRIIQSKLHCGSISPDLEDNRYNFAVSDLYSIVNIILPIFEYFKLNSSKINIYNLFKQAVVILLAKEHLKKDLTGKKKLVEIRSAIANLVENKQAGIVNKITVNWLIGFIEGDVTFSTCDNWIRMKFENTLVETQLFRAIISFLGLNPNYHKLEFPKLRERGYNESPVVVLAITPIDFLYKYLIPLLLSGDWYTQKFLDFKDWSILAKLQYFGYHNIPATMELINLIKSRMNNYRLTTDPDYKGKLIIPQSLFNKMFFLPSPYKDFGTFRVKPGSKGAQLLVHQVTYNFIATDLNSNKQISFSTVKDLPLLPITLPPPLLYLTRCSRRGGVGAGGGGGIV